METTIMENQMEKKMENEMETMSYNLTGWQLAPSDPLACSSLLMASARLVVFA